MNTHDTYQKQFQQCLEQAREIVEAHKVPGITLVAYVDVGGGGGSSKFKREGTTTSSMAQSLPPFLSGLLTENISGSALPAATAQSQNSFLQGILSRDPNDIPGQDSINDLLAQSPTGFGGRQTLQNLASIDPTASTYADDTQARYEDSVRQGIAAVNTGQENVRSGQGHRALREGEALNRMALGRTDELRRAQAQDAGMSMAGTQLLEQLEQGRRAAALTGQNQWVQQTLAGYGLGAQGVQLADSRRNIVNNLLAVASNALSTRNSVTADDLKGEGSQYSSHMGGGFSLCCFIFLEALNGKLPWYVRRARDIFVTEKRRAGYIRMSKWLVPLMQKHAFVKRLVNEIMIKPLMRWGAWYFGETPSGRLWFPAVVFWFAIWDLTGTKGE